MPDREKWVKWMQDETILSGVAIKCEDSSEDLAFDCKTLTIRCENEAITIIGDDIVNFPYAKTLATLLGYKVDFVVTSVTDEGIIGSMRKAQDMKAKPYIEKLEQGEVVEGQITYLTPHGAQITVGPITGFMRNYDFSDDGTEIRQVYTRWSPIKVKLKKVSSKGTYIFVPAVQKKGIAALKVDNLQAGQTVIGKITKASLEGYIVTIDAGIYVHCPPTRKYTRLQENDKVLVKIKGVSIKKYPYIKGSIKQAHADRR